MSVFRRSLAALALLAALPAAQASVVFSDDFSAGAPAATLDTVPTGWTVTNGGTVDLLPAGGNFASLCLGNAQCVDLDGSTGKAGALTRTLMLQPGVYSLALALSGSQRGDSNDVAVSLAGFGQTFSFGSSDGISTVGGNVTIGAAGSYDLVLLNAGGDNIGAVLHTVSLSTVPVPGALALMGVGLLGLGAVRRRG